MLARISYRKFDILHAKDVTAFPTPQRRIVEVSQSLHRSSNPTEKYVHAITPLMKFYVSDFCRFIVGAEQFRLQSIHFGDVDKLRQFPNELLRDMSGNAFEGSC